MDTQKNKHNEKYLSEDEFIFFCNKISKHKIKKNGKLGKNSSS